MSSSGFAAGQIEELLVDLATRAAVDGRTGAIRVVGGAAVDERLHVSDDLRGAAQEADAAELHRPREVHAIVQGHDRGYDLATPPVPLRRAVYLAEAKVAAGACPEYRILVA